ncbi:putative nuclease HARBI1 [Anastrepha obliqua]|uniref:putative nuclease HARBI1 n=1 Tax=Anastrepha obliqua TaxID=95512 RepID=UPI00240A7017|nr:putative nuclease HARBI1 [Anastrepha obliqua]XP_054746512.1 putative nuclease HARBI1 [Anastrepha obliqua]XP_054746513.1 putative nuclease HARBI1 [Anastrepha obliqua]
MERRYNNGDTSSWLLGDSGYPLEPWLMTPYRLRENETDVGKCIFNDIHSKARSIVERSIGVYKGSCILENIIGR